MIDSHCHLDQEPLFNNLEKVVERSNNSGVKLILTISTNIESFNKIKIIVKKFKNVYGTLGIHPHETNLNKNLNKKSLISMMKDQNKIIGIGETGLDYYYNHSDKDTQKKLFIEHIETSIKLNLPIIVHSRNAEDDTFNILNDFSSLKPKILMHCFTGSRRFCEKLLKINSFFSFSGIITFKNSSELQKTSMIVPMEKILIETDAPYLAPVPKRGAKNEPSFIIYTAKKLSELKNVTLDNIIDQTTNNFLNLFSLNLNK
tara:strand:+ start:121 stop:897 length:777 start_codon:yes stop_codon:yes gene_type:complete